MQCNNHNDACFWNNNKCSYVQYTITYNLDGGECSSCLSTADYRSEVTLPTNLKKTGYIFDSWYDSANKKVTLPIIVTDSMTFTAKWIINNYTINFITNCNTTFDDKIITYNETITLSNNELIKEGYKFKCWTNDTNTNSCFNDNTKMPANNITLYAKFIPNEYTITYMNDNTIYNMTTFAYNTTINYIKPDKIGYKFVCWSLDNRCSDLTVMPAHNITLIAKWIISNYTIKFITNCNTTLVDKIVTYNETIPTLPNYELIKEGYKFACWTLNDKCFNLTVMPAQNITLTAKWLVKENLKYRVEITFSKTNITRKEVEEKIVNIIGEDKYFEIVEEDNGEYIVIISYDETEETEEIVRAFEIESRASIQIYKQGAANTLYLSALLLFMFHFIF